MTVYTVQCGYAAYYATTVVVSAHDLDQALGRAIAVANTAPGWKRLDYEGPTFIDAATIGADADPWRDHKSALWIPERFTEGGEPRTVTVTVKNGRVENVAVDRGQIRVLINYDDDGDRHPHDQVAAGAPGDGDGAEA